MTEEIKNRIEQIKRGEVPEGYKKVPNIGIIPLDWNMNRLGNYLIQLFKTTKHSNQYPILTSSRKGIFLQSEYYKKEVASEDNTGYNIVPFGYFTYRHMSDDETFRFNINTIVENGIVSTLYPVFHTKNIDNYYLLCLLNFGREFRRYARLQKQGGSRTYMYFSKLQNLVVALPLSKEQKKITEILSTCDRLITNKEKLLEQKQLQKKWLMQNYLTGRKQIKRFSGKWKTQNLKMVLTENTRKKGTKDLPIFSVAVQKGLVDQIEHLGRSYAAQDTSNYNVVSFGNIVYTKSPTGLFPYGIVKQSQSEEDVAISPLYGVFSPKNYYLGYLLHTYFGYPSNANKYLLPIIQKGAKNTINISNETFLSGTLTLPTDEKEQTRLYEIFITADKEISLLQQDIEQTKQLKKGLMQLLLTGIVRVKP